MPTTPSSRSRTTDALHAHLTRLGLPVAGVNQRQAGLPGPLRRFHRRLLAAFVAHAGPPGQPAVTSMAADLSLDAYEALGALAAADLVHTDPTTGLITVAYPFSGRPTAHRVALAGGPTVWAMCAVDALGIPQMTGRDGQIRSTDPASGQPITVDAHDGAWHWQPATTVVLVATTTTAGACDPIADPDPGPVAEPVADCCCPYINFHADAHAAHADLRARPGMAGEVLTQAQAVDVARRVFGGLLNPVPDMDADDAAPGQPGLAGDGERRR